MTKPIDKTMIPVDPNARVMHMLSVPRGVQTLIHIQGSTDLVYIVNPTDGRAPFIVMRATDNDMCMTHRFGKSEDNNGNL